MSKIITSTHQNEAITQIFGNINGLLHKDRTQLIMACGTGKSIIAVRSTEKNININSLDNSITVLFFPSLYLVNQTYKTFAENTHINSFKPLVVCSDKNIIENENDDIFELDASEVDYPVTTNIDEIKKYLGDINIAHKIIFVTYHSSYLVGTSLLELNLIADFGIFDEAHKTAIKNNNKSNSYAIALDDNDFPIKKRLFMTATPKHYSFNVNDDVFEDESDENLVFSMNNESLYGNISFEYSMRDAIEDGVIADYKILAILIDDNYVHKFKNLKKIKKQGKITQSKFIEKEIREAKLKAIEQTMKKFGITKGLAFNSTIDESKRFARFSNSEVCPDLEIVHVDGQTSHKERETIVNKLKDNTDNYIITNSKLFTEGVDLPEVALVAILKNMASKSDIIQTVGRSQRFTRIDGKIVNPDKIGYILLPIFISDMNISEQELKKESELTSLFEIVNSLRENDRQLRTDLLFRKASRKERAEKFNDELEEVENKAIANLEITHINLIEESLNEKRENTTNDKISKNNIEHKKFEEELATFIGNVDSIILNKRAKEKTEKEWKKLFVDFIKKNGIENLNGNTKYENLGSKVKNIKNEYNESSSNKQKEIREFWDCFPDDFWERKKKTDKEWKELFVDFIKKNGIENLKSNTKLDNIRKKYNESSSNKQKEIREFWDCFPDDFLKTRTKTDKEWKELFVDFIKKNGIENLNGNTKYENLGNATRRIKSRYKEALLEEKEEIRKFWDCFPDDFWKRKASIPKTEKEWKKLFVDFIKKNGIENLNGETKYENLGNKVKNIKNEYNKSLSNKQKEIREFWDCFPDDFWERKISISKTDKEWKELFIDFIKKNGIENLKSNTKYNKLGAKLSIIRRIYKEALPEKKEEIRKFWDCFPDDFFWKYNTKAITQEQKKKNK